MSLAYYIVLNRSDLPFDSFVNGKALARQAEPLAALAQQLALPTLEDLTSYSAEELEAVAVELGTAAGAHQERWFPAEEGLRWVARIRASLESNPEAVRDTGAIVSELAEYEAVLRRAESAGAKWHLAIDF